VSEWQPIETAPIRDLLNEGPFACLVYSKETGVKTGRVWRYAEGHVGSGTADSFHGDWNITHWMPLPEPPNG